MAERWAGGMRRRTVATVVVALVTGLMTMAPALGAGQTSPGSTASKTPVPDPTVTGPVTGGIKGFPFAASPVKLSSYGYVEQEYLYTGTATAYDASPVGLASAGPPPAPLTAPYVTRMLVRRPAQQSKFNGTVVVEWLNDTSGFDVDAAGGDLWRELLRDGYAYVGITAQAVGASALHAYDPVRYATVSIPDDQFSYDIFAQAAQALRHHIGADPLGGLRPQRILATGDSQSGSTLNTYINNVYDLTRPVFDGFLVMTSATALRANLDVPVLRVTSELEVDNEAPWTNTRLFRQWEVAGGGHTDYDTSTYLVPEENREWGTPPGITWPLAPTDEPNCLLDRMPKYPAIQAALVALTRWVSAGTPPPTAPPITVSGGAIVRDGYGNALGGLRLPGEDAATGANYGEASNECGPTLGKTAPFSEAQIKALYPTHRAYVDAVRTAADRAVRAGWLLPADAAMILSDAQRSSVD